jgi:NodT family efflux transporter outer membrane factor (OMF) lipoprotein
MHMFDPKKMILQTTSKSAAASLSVRRSVGILGLAVLQLTGCTVGPDYQKPLAPAVVSLTREPLETLRTTLPDEISSEWWKAYGSPRINLLVAQALHHNPSLEAGLANLQVAQEMVNAQRGYFFPQVQAGYAATRQNSGTVLSPALSSGSTLFNLHTAQLNVGFVPDLFGGNRRQVESLQASESSQQYQLEAFKITLVSNVVTAAIAESFLSQQIDLTQQAMQVAGEQLQQLKGLSAAGYASGMDVAQQQVAYAQTLALLPPLQKQIEQTRNLLAVLCGQLPSQRLPGGALDEIHAPAALPTVVASSLVERRPDVQAAQEQLHASNAQIGVATANMLPQLSLSASLLYNNNSLAGLLSNASKSWGLLGGLTQPLFDGGVLSARKRGAIAAAEVARAQYQSVVLVAFQNVADTLYALDSDSRSFNATRDVELANQQLWGHTQRQFEQGYSSRLILLAAQQSLLQSQLSRLTSQAVYLSDTVALYQSLGGGWHAPDSPVAALESLTSKP